jgi:hypothetical protein
MKAGIVFTILMIMLLFTACEENNYYNTDPRLFNDAMHGNIVGKILQTNSRAVVIASQVEPVDSILIDPTDGSFEINNLPIGNYDLTIKADNYRIYKRCNVMIQGGGTTYIGEVDLSTIPDLVASHYPEDKGEIVYNNRYARLTISMTFTQPMDRESVEKAFSTDPPTEGIFYWGYYSTSPNWIYYEDALGYRGFDAGATITTYSKITSFSYQVSQKDSYTDTTYNVMLATSAKDTAGNFLRFPLTFSFSTIQSSSTLNGIQTSPYHGDVDVSLISNSGISIIFPRNMNQKSTEESITVIPGSDIIFIWPQKNSLTIYTGGVFRADTKYTVTIDSLARDLDGNKLGNTFSFYFTTASVGVSYTSPNNGELFVSTGTDIHITFNTYMIKSSVQNALSISPGIPGTLDWSNNSKTMMKFSPSQSLKYNTKYTITIGTNAMDIFSTHLKEPYSFSFITRPE